MTFHEMKLYRMTFKNDIPRNDIPENDILQNDI
jgi:hypothetical protein